MNIYHVNPDIIRFNIFNLLGDSVGLCGHFGFYFNLKNGKYVMWKKGGFGSLTWYPEEKNKELFVPNKEQIAFLEKAVQKRLETAHYYDRYASCHKGKFLLPSLREQEEQGEYLSYKKMYFVWEKDDYASDEQKELDKKAQLMLDIICADDMMQT
jgi:hypothetical protein